MLKSLLARDCSRGTGRSRIPAARRPTLPDRFRGLPVARPTRSARTAAGRAPRPVRPTRSPDDRGLRLDLGRCLFCTDCVAACPEGAIRLRRTTGSRPRRRDDLRRSTGQALRARGGARGARLRRLFGRSLKLRQVSAGGCNGCEADVNVLGTVVFDLGRFGIQFVASPRHADGLLVTGPVTENMRLALRKTYEAVPAPKIVIAVGACAICGGPYAGHPEEHDGASTRPAGRPLHPRLPAASAHDPRRAAAPPRPARRTAEGASSLTR